MVEEISTIQKRDGGLAPFDKDKIAEAIHGASVDAKVELDAEMLAEKVVSKLGKSPTVEEVQDATVLTLMNSRYKKVATFYIKYRTHRDDIREGKNTLSVAIDSILERTDDELLFENGNVDSKTLTSQRTLLMGEVAKVYANKILPEDVVEAHENGEVHYHDKTFSPMQAYTNCALVDIKGMLENGFVLGGAHIGSSKSIGVATAVVAQIVAQVSSSMYGGTSMANLDTVLAPYVTMNIARNRSLANKWGIKDVEAFVKEETEKEVYNAFQGLEYELNSLFNSHAQSPFTTVSFGMGTSWESREIQKAILQVRLKGLGDKEVTAIFPKLILFIEDGLNLKPEDGNYDIKQLALKCAARRQYPDIISAKNNRDITGSSVPVTSMG